MSTWPNRGGLRRPLRGAGRENNRTDKTVRPRQSDSSQQASSKPGAVQTAADAHRAEFDQRYDRHLRHLKLKGLQPKTIEAYSRAIRRLGVYFDHRIDDLNSEQLSRYFSDLLDTHSWSSVKLDLYGYKFYTVHVLGRPWVMPSLVKAPKTQRLPDIVTVDEAECLFAATCCLSYRVLSLPCTAWACAWARAGMGEPGLAERHRRIPRRPKTSQVGNRMKASSAPLGCTC